LCSRRHHLHLLLQLQRQQLRLAAQQQLRLLLVVVMQHLLPALTSPQAVKQQRLAQRSRDLSRSSSSRQQLVRQCHGQRRAHAQQQPQQREQTQAGHRQRRARQQRLLLLALQPPVARLLPRGVVASACAPAVTATCSLTLPWGCLQCKTWTPGSARMLAGFSAWWRACTASSACDSATQQTRTWPGSCELHGTGWRHCSNGSAAPQRQQGRLAAAASSSSRL
jgi:hypothetical protein